MKKIIIKIGIALGLLSPSFAFATTDNLASLITLIVSYFNIGVGLIIGLATLMFVWNVFRYFIASGDDAGAKKEAGLYVMYSVIGFFVILSFWGLVNILNGTLKLRTTQPDLPFGSFTSSNSSSNTGVFTAPSTNRVPATTNTPSSNSTTNIPANNSTTNRQYNDPSANSTYSPYVNVTPSTYSPYVNTGAAPATTNYSQTPASF